MSSAGEAERNKELVRRFYRVLWEDRDLAEMASILHEDVTFRGSLGQEKRGHAGFAGYVAMVHEALGDYRCVIEDLVAEGDRVFARMTFTGIHRGDFLGHPPSGERVTWSGAALFTFRDGRAADVWVLGDLISLVGQLERHGSGPEDGG